MWLITKKPAMSRLLIVGAARFELTISWSQTKRDTGLRYAPINDITISLDSIDDLGAKRATRYRATLRPDPFKERKDTFSFQIHYPQHKILTSN